MPTDMTRFQTAPTGFLMYYVRKHWRGHAVVLGAVVAAVACSVFSQYSLKTLIDVVSHGPENAGNGAWVAFGVLCALITADNFTWRIGGWAAAYVFVEVTGDVRADLFAHLSRHSTSYFADRLPGTLASRITATSNAIYQTENIVVWNVIPPVLAVSLAIGLIGSVNLLMAGCLAVVATGMAAVVFRLAARGTPIHRDFAGQAAAVDGEFVDVITNMNVVRAFGATLREQSRIGERIGYEMAARRRSLFYMEKLRILHALSTAIITAGLLGWAIWMWQNGQATVGDINLICGLGFTILHGTRDLAVSLVDLTQQVARLDEALVSLLEPHTMPDAVDAEALQAGPGNVVFDHVTFAYPGRPPILRDLDLNIRAGQRVGLVGASGAGKSTVLALLQRFYDADTGLVRIDGQDITAVTQSTLNVAMAVVPQDTALFNRSVLENIRYARPDASEADVLRAAETARCREFIEALPDGFATQVGNRGTRLSGGQRQRLAIARALLKDAPILLLDEATSALDSDSEQAIQVALDRLMQGRTVIAVAHRLSTLKSFDRIVVMDAGRVIDDGPPAVLAARPGPYRELLRKQGIEEKLAAV